MTTWSPPEIPIPPEVIQYENEFQLPALVGSVRQIAWARLIRHQVLSCGLPQLMDITAGMSVEEAEVIYQGVQRLRLAQDAAYWIQTGKSYRGKSAELFKEMPAIMQKEKAEAQVNAGTMARHTEAAANRDAWMSPEVPSFEAACGLPKLRAASPRQETYGRQCRYRVLRNLPPEELAQKHDLWCQHRHAATWIAAFVGTKVAAGSTGAAQGGRSG